MEELLLTLVLIFAFLFFVINMAKTVSGRDWSCFFGNHTYHYSFIKHGMVVNKYKTGVTGSKQRVHQCRCGHVTENKNE